MVLIHAYICVRMVEGCSWKLSCYVCCCHDDPQAGKLPVLLPLALLA